ncbi:acylamino-acid-releasing enzyme-like isoform X2 [Lycium barbarum]|uniref:acylamino-acid-releasing enzyme-like isoform X2 n=1 Tax=Lycium barbarum TaxID=112863 RepID=UPI00293F277D|nr:acylamino-acid-releasing enzyme-like isoform X2 [Lycium barbarum]
MENAEASPLKRFPLGLDETSEEEYSSQSALLQDFASIPTIDKAWTFTSTSGSQCMFSVSQPNLLANKNRRYVVSSHISKGSANGLSFQWAAFPIEMPSGSIMVPSPSGSKLLVVRNPEKDSPPTKFEIWGPSQVEKEFHISASVHGSVYSDGWFEGISWNDDETFVAYVAEEPAPLKPVFTNSGYKKGNSSDKECGSWKGQGDWEEDWGETYPGKREPAIFVINVNSGEVYPVEGTKKLTVGQVVWAPASGSLQHYLVFVGWPSDTRKLGIKYCYNRPCALYAVRAPFSKPEDRQSESNAVEEASPVKLTQRISSAFAPRFSPDRKGLVFLSAKSSVDSFVHSATQSLHRIDWSIDGKPTPDADIVDVVRAILCSSDLYQHFEVPVVMCPEDGCFPGLYTVTFLSKPWLSDGYTMILSSVWGSTEVILSVNVLSGKVSRISPGNSSFSWSLLALDGDSIIAVCSSPCNVPEIKYGSIVGKSSAETSASWLDISSPIRRCSEKVTSLLSSRQSSIIKIPVRDISENLTAGASKPYEAIFVSSKCKSHNLCDPLIVVLHGGPHFISLSSFSKSLAFLSAIGYSLLIVNYRGSSGFGEEALQSLPGKIGSQDVNDVLAAIDHVIDMGLADPSKITVLGGSHGGFLTTHLIGQAPDKFAAAATRNPVCSIPLMVGTSDIPDWCYAETFGRLGKSMFTEAPSSEHLAVFHSKSPISHISKVKTPILFLLGAKDLRVPICTSLQYARALKEKGTEVKVLVFPEDNHAIDRPQSDFESFLNIGVWFKKHCK